MPMLFDISWIAVLRCSKPITLFLSGSPLVITARCHPFPMQPLRAICGVIWLAFASTPLSAQAAATVDTMTLPVIASERAAHVDSAAVPLGAWSGLRREFLSSSTPMRVALGASFDQFQKAPKEWPRTFRGLGQRSGVRLAEVSAQLFVLYGTAAVFGQDPTYRPRRHGSAWARTQHAFIGSVSAYRPDGSRVFALGTFTGAVAATVVSKQLLPATTTRAQIVSRGTSMLSNRVVRSLWQEFLSPRPL